MGLGEGYEGDGRGLWMGGGGLWGVGGELWGWGGLREGYEVGGGLLVQHYYMTLILIIRGYSMQLQSNITPTWVIAPEVCVRRMCWVLLTEL